MNAPLIRIKNFGRGLFRFITIHATDRRTDRQDISLMAKTALHGMQSGKNKKKVLV